MLDSWEMYEASFPCASMALLFADDCSESDNCLSLLSLRVPSAFSATQLFSSSELSSASEFFPLFSPDDSSELLVSSSYESSSSSWPSSSLTVLPRHGVGPNSFQNSCSDILWLSKFSTYQRFDFCSFKNLFLIYERVLLPQNSCSIKLNSVPKSFNPQKNFFVSSGSQRWHFSIFR